MTEQAARTITDIPVIVDDRPRRVPYEDIGTPIYDALRLEFLNRHEVVEKAEDGKMRHGKATPAETEEDRIKRPPGGARQRRRARQSQGAQKTGAGE